MPALGQLIDDYLDAAQADGTSREELRALRGSLAHVSAADLSLRDAATIRRTDLEALVRDLREAGVPADRATDVVQALRPVYAHAMQDGLVPTSPLVGYAPAAATAGPSPTTAIVALGVHAVTWVVRAIVVAFVLTTIGLVVALL